MSGWIRGPWKSSFKSASALIKTGAGHVKRLIIGATNTATTVQVYDNTAGSGTIIHQAVYQATVAQDVWEINLDLDFSTGLYVKLTGGTPTVTIIYE